MEHLVGSERNPVPDGAIVGRFEVRPRVGLRYARWPSRSAEPKGTVVFLQGQADCIERFLEVYAELLARGFAVVTFDWHGQGGSDRLLDDRRRGHTDDFSDYERDLDRFMAEIVRPHSPAPYVVLTHSIGGLIWAGSASATSFDRAVLSAPAFSFAIPNPLMRVMDWATRQIARRGLRDRAVPGYEFFTPDRMPFALNRSTSDPERYDRYAATLKETPGLAVGSPTFGWLDAFAAARERAASAAFTDRLRMPVLILGGDDRVIDTRAGRAFAARLADGRHVAIPGARHTLMLERDALRREFWAAFDGFIAEQPR